MKALWLLVLLLLGSCGSEKNETMQSIVFLHHSTGRAVLRGGTSPLWYRLTGKGDVYNFLVRYNRKYRTDFAVQAKDYPGEAGYGGYNYPYDYYNIWVKHAGELPYKGQETLELLTRQFDVVVFKHCFPVGMMLEDTGQPSADDPEKRLENYQMQYNALKQKMHSFPKTVFVVWTPPALLKEATSEEQALRLRDFYLWMVREWDEEGDNIFLWDFYALETEGSLYLKPEYAVGLGDSHPNRAFAARMAPLFASFVVDCASHYPQK